MQLSQYQYKSNKHPEDFTDHPLLKWMITSGIVKYDSVVGTLYTPFGKAVHESVNRYILSTLNSGFKPNEYILNKGFENALDAVDSLFSMTKFDYKSYKALPNLLSLSHQSSEDKMGFDHVNLFLNESDFDNRGIQKNLIQALNELTDFALYFNKDKAKRTVTFITEDMGDLDCLVCESCGFGDEIHKVGIPGDHKKIEEMPKELETGVAFDSDGTSVFTPDITKIDALSNHLGIEEKSIMKAIALMNDLDMPVMILISGDKNLNLNKLKERTGSSYRFATDEEIESRFKSIVGFVGPRIHKKASEDDNTTNVESSIEYFVDLSILPNQNYCAGANEKDYHRLGIKLTGIEPNRYLDVSEVVEGDPCPVCGHRLKKVKAAYVSQIIDHDSSLSERHRANYLEASGKAFRHKAVSFHLSLGVLEVITFAKRGYEKKSLVDFMPFSIWLMTVNHKKDDQVLLAENIYKRLEDRSIGVIYDDRFESPGVKFFDSKNFEGLGVIAVGREAEQGTFTYQKGQEKKEGLTIDDLFFWVEGH